VLKFLLYKVKLILIISIEEFCLYSVKSKQLSVIKDGYISNKCKKIFLLTL